MRASQVALAGAFALALGILGYVLGTGARDDRPDGRTVPPPEAPPAERAPAPPPPEPPPPPPPADPRRPDAPGDRERRLRAGLETYLESLELPAAVLDEAEALGVPARALRLAYAAEWWLHAEREFPGPVEKEGVRAALAALAAEGERGFLAVVAQIRGQGFGAYYTPMVEATWRPGLEQRLFDAIDDLLPRGGAVHRVYAALGAVDTDEVRRYLRAALERHEHHATNFAGAASALGRLGDAEAAPLVAAALRKGSWVGLRPTLLSALGGMGGDAARQALLDYLRQPRANLESYAVRALSRIDPALARAEAEALLTGRREQEITATERQRLQAFLAE